MSTDDLMDARTMSPRPKVLVVEDDAITRMSAAAMLSDAGYAVVEADGGTAAVLALESTDDIQAMLTDIDMPAGLNGIVLAACVDRRWPRISIVMTSGKVRPVPGDVPTRARFIPKPYTEEVVLDAIGTALATRGRPVEGVRALRA